MTHNPSQSSETSWQVDGALGCARELTERRAEDAYSATWAHEAAHVGDLSVLALALLRDR